MRLPVTRWESASPRQQAGLDNSGPREARHEERWSLPLLVILTGVIPTLFVNLFGHGYDYRTTVAPWFRGVFTGSPTSPRSRTPRSSTRYTPRPRG